MSSSIHVGTLSDVEITQMCDEGLLIQREFCSENVQQACYELRASAIYYDLSCPTHERGVIPPDHPYILIKPKQSVAIETMESLMLPNDILGHIITKGRLFFAGLLPVNTFADPGFTGPLQIVMHNFSNHYLRIKPGQAIAKIEFSRLAINVAGPYRGTVSRDLTFIEDDYVVSRGEALKDPRVREVHEELERSFGSEFGSAIRRVFSYERRVLLATVAYLTFTTIIVGIGFSKDGQWISPVMAVTLGVVSNIAFALLTWGATTVRNRR